MIVVILILTMLLTFWILRRIHWSHEG
jgi:hypothetical protein